MNSAEREYMKLVDTHAHLEEFKDIHAIVERARKVGVVGIVGVGVGYFSNLKTLELSEVYSGFIFPALGVHPTEVEKEGEKVFDLIEERAKDCVAIGEVGLDYWAKTSRERQNMVLERLLTIAARRNKPVSLHTRGAWEETYNLVEQFKIKKVIFHWFTGPTETLKKILDRGYYISASPAAEYSKRLRENLKLTPLDNILLETDSPVKYKEVEAEPAHVLKTLKYVAELKGIKEAALAEKTTENATNFFELRFKQL
ncbi:MAG: TatD DNase family protein [Thermoproteota archaeon]|nr:TatD DNase family protein [Thermoproteota archaeon]